ncbi:MULTISPECIES: DUF3429 domain-containing protein [unclassified Psychrobacter]|uniref:DUF3429 domain-containing protein n=1 Tax=unclassified Psychrobacter TaxID=196806 RepID=UPI00086A84B3|nr:MULTISPECIES: DUF3429 domain-containing protein [unclassified Psychrobacter]OEH68646.1 MAG: hypothetical protein BAX61_00020 [Psychrobacter sp. B29-1]TEW86014.1 DUF3429 domain-containing protein [Psychrobacter sp. 230]|tara:strand:- start:252 stop:689 length:438 start_codon:yes stop_codon:yes gene_type:complete
MKKPSPYLTFAGAIPFVACAFLLMMNVVTVPILGSVVDILSAYGLVIASFMAGAHWGNHLDLADDNKWAIRLPLYSNVIALGLWLGFLILSPSSFIWLLVIGFISLLVIDYSLHRAQIISHAYFKVRQYVTAIVVISLVIAALQL